MSDKIYEFDNSNLNEDWKDLIKEMFLTGVEYQDDPEKLREASEEMQNKMYSLIIGREINSEELKFYQARVIPLDCLNKMIALFDKGFDSTYSDYIPKVLESMLLCKDILRPLFVEMRDKILNELKEKNLYHKGLEK